MRDTANSLQNQNDGIYSQTAKNHEQNRNTAPNCKTVSDIKENPGALAGASGARETKLVAPIDYTSRIIQARALRSAIADCDPHDADLILSDVLERMRKGAPIPPLMNAREEFDEWAVTATTFERKAMLLACYQNLTPKEQAGFRYWASEEAQA